MNPASCSHIGIDISGRTIHAVQLVRRADTWTAAAIASFPRLEGGTVRPENEASRIAHVLRRHGFRACNVSLAAPDDRLLTAVIDLPPRSSGAPVAQIARTEMSRLFKRDAATLETALWELPATARPGGGVPTMAVACPYDASASLLDAFTPLGFRIRSLVPRGLALARASQSWLAPSACGSLIIDVGWESAKLIVILQNVLVYERTLEGAEFSRLRNQIAARARIEPEIADLYLAGDSLVTHDSGNRIADVVSAMLDEHARNLCEQVRVSVTYLGHRYPGTQLGRVLLVGEHAPAPGLAQRLTLGLNTEVRSLSMLDAAGLPPHLSDRAGDTGPLAAAGLAMLSLEARS